MKHFLQLSDFPAETITALIDSAIRHKQSRLGDSMRGKVIALIFEKPSLRTRVSFEAGIAQLRGTSLFIPGSDIGFGIRESLADFSQTMSRYVDAMILRVLKHETLNTIVKHSRIPIINGLSDRSHPCQALADLMTIQEHCHGIAGKTIVFVGDGNNVARSLAVGAVRLGANFLLACPHGYGFDAKFVTECTKGLTSSQLKITHDPFEAVKTADVIYVDVWTSMGQESESETRSRDFAAFQVNAKLLNAAPKCCKVLHCLPARRGEEITDNVLDGPQSVVFDQAENRLHAQKAVLEFALAESLNGHYATQ